MQVEPGCKGSYWYQGCEGQGRTATSTHHTSALALLTAFPYADGWSEIILAPRMLTSAASHVAVRNATKLTASSTASLTGGGGLVDDMGALVCQCCCSDITAISGVLPLL